MSVRIEQATTTDTTSSDDEGTQYPRRNARKRKNVYNVNGQGFHCLIGKNGKIEANQWESIRISNETNVLEHFEAFLQRIAASRGPEKDRIECFVLTKLLRDIESHALTNGGNSNDTLEILARLASPTLKSPRITKHALKLLDKFVSMDIGKGVTNSHIIGTEKCLREPIVDGSLREELVHDQRRRLDVYLNVLSAILIGLASEHLSYPYEKMDIENCISRIEEILGEWSRPRKYRKRHFLESILAFLQRLLDKKNMHEGLKKLLALCKRMLKDGFDQEQVDDLLKRIKNDSVSLFVIVKMLHAKSKDCHKAYDLVKAIITSHSVFSPTWQTKQERYDWHFALLACQIFVDVTVNYHLKAKRKDAAVCLMSFRNTRAYKKSVVICGIVEKHISKALFAYDVESRLILFGNCLEFDRQDKIELLRKRICSINLSSYLEISDIVCENEHYVTMRGRYEDKPVAIKAICVSASTLLAIQDKEKSPEIKGIENEAFIMKHLNSETNDYVPTCYSADLYRLPHHIVMEHAENGDLCSHLKNRRGRNPPSYREVLQILFAVAKAMEFVHKKMVIHCRLRAEHILVGQSHNCVKVSGFSQAKLVRDEGKGLQAKPLEHDDPTIRWAAPCRLKDLPIYSFRYDTWSFGVFMYEVITCGGLPYADKTLKKIKEDVLAGRFLAKEKNMIDDYYTLIQRCFGDESISFSQICRELEILLRRCSDKDDLPMTIPEDISTIYSETDKDVYQGVFTDCDFSRRKHNDSSKVNCVMRQAALEGDSKNHVMKLKALDHPFLVKIVGVNKTKNGTTVSFEHFSGQCLGDRLKCHSYAVDELTRFCAQICSAINYLHSLNIVHCNITLNNVVVVDDKHVKLTGLQYSNSLLPTRENAASPICSVMGGDLEQHLYRWNAIEVIQESIYSKESDIWSLGILMWVIFSCLELKREEMKPFPQYEDTEILDKLKIGSRPSQTMQCPDWLYAIMTQCWLRLTSERASSLSILECLTHRTPWESYLLQTWLKRHKADICENWPNLSAHQRLADEFIPPSRENVMESIPEECVSDHTYDYQVPQWKLRTRLKNLRKNIKYALGVSRTSHLLVESTTSIKQANKEGIPCMNKEVLNSHQEDTSDYTAWTGIVSRLNTNQPKHEEVDEEAYDDVSSIYGNQPKHEEGYEGSYDLPADQELYDDVSSIYGNQPKHKEENYALYAELIYAYDTINVNEQKHEKQDGDLYHIPYITATQRRQGDLSETYDEDHEDMDNDGYVPLEWTLIRESAAHGISQTSVRPFQELSASYRKIESSGIIESLTEKFPTNVECNGYEPLSSSSHDPDGVASDEVRILSSQNQECIDSGLTTSTKESEYCDVDQMVQEPSMEENKKSVPSLACAHSPEDMECNEALMNESSEECHHGDSDMKEIFV